MSQTKKKAVSGWIKPRWPKERVTKWLEFGAIPAVIGLWFPDWIGGFAGDSAFHIPLPFMPPFLTYIGALILLKACYEGIRNMGLHFKGLLISGGLALSAAGASVVLWLLKMPVATLTLIGLAAFFAAGYIWFTIGKVWEITQETRAHVTWHAIWIGSVIAAAAYLLGISQLAAGGASGVLWLRIGVALFTAVFFICRYGVHIYKTQQSIGARFEQTPDDQYWAGTC